MTSNNLDSIITVIKCPKCNGLAEYSSIDQVIKCLDVHGPYNMTCGLIFGSKATKLLRWVKEEFNKEFNK